ncbi:FAD-dependent oxidoreductase [Bosea sp. ASV33]|uniref:GcvT family protein n=1 Tax=Bosea sp. ASV33 TaxID=2795106 RepID=UPI0018EC4E6A|nr:FAD-dependent oxidoreductase [Bosea sp. ASV33]
MSIPTQSRVVIIGGGIIGCSVAYHLTKLGWRDVLLLEQGRLSSGTTWHAAGLVGQLRSQSSMTRLIRYSTELYASLENETGLATGWKRCGSVSVARTQERMTQLRRTISAARAQGVEIEELTPQEAGEKWPVMRTDDLVGGVWLPGDGKANPSDITQALARGARSGGATVREGIRVTGIETEKGRVKAVQTDQGRVECEVLVICAGQWSRAIGQMCGVSVPLHSAEHMYIVTGKIAGVTPDLPVMRDPDGYIYFKEEVGGLVMGGFEPDAKPWGMDGIPHPFEFQLLPDDWDQFGILMENALERVPALETAEIKTFLNGPESFTPDNNFLLGEAPEVAGVYVGAGFNSMGIASAGGAGRALAEWIVEGEATSDLWPVDIRRFADFNNNPAWLKDRIKETLGLHYAMPWPNRELDTARPFRRSPLYDRLAAKGAVFGSKMGWERANYFARTEDERMIGYSFGPQNWFETVAAEHRACREAAGLVDMSSFAKFLLQGPQAEAALQRLAANDIAVPVGTSVYTALLNARGTFESDLTAARIAPDTYLLLTGTAQATRDAHWIRRQLPEGVTLTDVTSSYAVLSLAGPKVPEILARLSPTSFDLADFPANAIRKITIGYATTWACRRSYLDDGFELYAPVEFTAAIYDALHEAGADLGLVDVGYYAVDSLRIEKGFRAWGRELTPDVNPYEAGLGFAVKLGKGEFLGREALIAAKAAPRTKRLIALVGPRPDGQMAWGGEAILADGKPVGEITSAAFGASVDGIVALGWASSDHPIDQGWLDARSWSIDLAGTTVPVSASLAAPLDRKA